MRRLAQGRIDHGGDLLMAHHTVHVRRQHLLPINTLVRYALGVQHRFIGLVPFESGQRRRVSVAHRRRAQPVDAMVSKSR